MDEGALYGWMNPASGPGISAALRRPGYHGSVPCPSPTREERTWYSEPGPLTDISAHAEWLRGMPGDVSSLCRVVQGILLHGNLGLLYGLDFSQQRREAETNLRSASERLDLLLTRDDRPLAEPRPLERRQLGTCRDFTLLLCALLRWQGRMARARCGFAGYFVPRRYEDHWVCEVWDDDAGRWRLVDAQIDDVQRRLFGPKNPLDVSREEFITGGEAWAGVRSGSLDPEQFGLTTIAESGLWFICGDFVRDVAALNKVELLPWDQWGVMHRPSLGKEPFSLRADEVISRLPPTDLAELDRVASIASGWIDFSAVRSAYEDDRWRVPPTHPALAHAGF